MRALVMACALVVTGAAFAGDTVNFGQRVISVGDSAGRVREAAGRPDNVVVLETGYGGRAGERWEYFRDGKTIMIYVTGGRVTGIDEMRD